MARSGALLDIAAALVITATITGLDPLIATSIDDEIVKLRDLGEWWQQETALPLPLGVTVAQLYGLVLARTCARRHSRATKRTIFEKNIDFYGWISTRIENLAGDNVCDD